MKRETAERLRTRTPHYQTSTCRHCEGGHYDAGNCAPDYRPETAYLMFKRNDRKDGSNDVKNPLFVQPLTIWMRKKDTEHQVDKAKLRLCLYDGLFGLATPSWPTSLESSDGWTQLDVIMQTEDIGLPYQWNEDH
ncbi:hypothetical protein [Absidia glauca]|uniref:Uncharacterized protein n=1 Tax=Absidia glauca TaxID=4829 RepID=A0A168N6J1_ABSGL|nr:hypothetical protein [Absidia glauca]